MKKPIAAAVLAALLLLAFSGCNLIHGIVDGLASGSEDGGSATGSTLADVEQSADQFSRETQFTNTFLGVSFKVPSGWWEYRRNSENFNESPATTTDTATLDIEMQDGYRYIDLGKFASLQDSTRANHLGVDFYAERIDGLDTLDSYTQDYEDYMLTPDEAYGTYTLEDSDDLELLGRGWTLREYGIPQEGGDFRLLTLVCELETGYYLVVEADYWPENTEARQTVISLLEKSLTLSDTL